MVNTLSIKNYKSIKSLEIKPSRVNIFIGEHNSGKSNILEALSWFSTNALSNGIFSEMFRFKNTTDFFFDFDTSFPIEVKTDDLSMIIRYGKTSNGALRDGLEGLIYKTDSNVDFQNQDDWFNLRDKIDPNLMYAFGLSFDGEINNIGGQLDSSFRTYIFKKVKSFEKRFTPFLNPPFGENIPTLLIANKMLKEQVSNIFREKGFRLMIKPNEGDINMAKDVNDELYSYPYTSISETIQRIVFYQLAIESNNNAVLVLDEPESNTFPMYTKQLAELIALDTSNQYFLATHDPYILSSLVSKTPVNELSVFVVKMNNYETSIKKIEESKLSDLLDQGIDIYFNLNQLIRVC